MARCTQLVPLALALALGGCFKDAEVVPDTEAVIALKNVKDEWLTPCIGLGDLPGTAVGDLLQDMNNASALGAECKERHNSFIEYIGPLIRKAKQQEASPP